MLADGYEPRFDRDYSFGRDGEKDFDTLLEAVAKGYLRVEVKRKRARDCELYVETEQNAYGRGDWKPSGINVCTAEYVAFEFDTTGSYFLTPTDRILHAIDLGLGRGAACGGSNPTRGRLLNLGLLISTRCDQ
jgi:hypothetical protein